SADRASGPAPHAVSSRVIESPGWNSTGAAERPLVAARIDAEDLAWRRPGSGARDQARRAREAAPVRTVLARLMGVHTTERAWRLGAEGEEIVGAQLGRLGAKAPRWRVLHAVHVGEEGAAMDR